MKKFLDLLFYAHVSRKNVNQETWFRSYMLQFSVSIPFMLIVAPILIIYGPKVFFISFLIYVVGWLIIYLWYLLKIKSK